MRASYQFSMVRYWTDLPTILSIENKEMPNMILITGAGGNVGQEVLKQIAGLGKPVRAAFQSAQKAAAAPPGVEAVLMDYNQPETVRAALRDVDRVFLVGPATVNLPELERKAMNEIKQSGVRLVVKLSAMGPREVSFPGLHRESEDYIRSSGVPYTFLRPNGFMQNLVIYSQATIRTDGVFYGSQGQGQVSYIDLRDIGAVAVKTLTEDNHAEKTYTLTGPEALSNNRVAEILSARLGREIRYIDLSPKEMKHALLSAGTPEWSANSILELNELYRNGGASTVSGDVERVLGRKPTTLEQFSRDYAAIFQTAKGAQQTAHV
jgi:uncharacterized protein YbjT (DUF2867 family)